MPSSRILIASNTLSSSAASVTFSSIPSTYTDLVLRISARVTGAGLAYDSLNLFPNGVSSNGSRTDIYGNGATAASSRGSNFTVRFALPDSSYTSNTFANIEFYLPDYNSTSAKPFSGFATNENNSTTAYITSTALLNRNTTAITSLTLEPVFVGSGSNFVAGSSFFLYGLKNS